MTISVAELFTDPDFMEDTILRRPTVHMANEGEAIASYDPDVTFSASVQPVPASEVNELPEGQRGSGKVYRIYTATELKFSPGKTDISDVLYSERLDASMVVVGEEDWSGGGYRKFVAVEYKP